MLLRVEWSLFATWSVSDDICERISSDWSALYKRKNRKEEGRARKGMKGTRDKEKKEERRARKRVLVGILLIVANWAYKFAITEIFPDMV